MQWLLSVTPLGSQLKALKCLALAQAALSSRGATCKWLLDSGVDGTIYVVKKSGKQGLYALYVRNSEIKEALAVSLYRRSCRILPIKEAVQMNGYRAPW